MSKRTDRKALKKRRAAYAMEGDRRRHAAYIERLKRSAKHAHDEKARVLAMTMDMHNAQMYHDNPELFAAARSKGMIADEVNIPRHATSGELETRPRRVTSEDGDELKRSIRAPTMAQFDEIAERARESSLTHPTPVDRLA